MRCRMPRVLVPLLLVLAAVGADAWRITNYPEYYPNLNFTINSNFQLRDIPFPEGWRLRGETTSHGVNKKHQTHREYDCIETPLARNPGKIKYFQQTDKINEFDTWENSRLFADATLNFMARYDELSYNGKLRGVIVANKAPPVPGARSIDPVSAAIGAISAIIALVGLILDNKKTHVPVIKTWEGRMPPGNVVCPSHGIANDTQFYNDNYESGNPFRVFGPFGLADRYSIRITDEYMMIYPRANYMRWLIGVDCYFNGVRYSAAGDSVVIYHKGGEGTCTISGTAITLELMKLYHRKSGKWRDNWFNAIRLVRAGEFSFHLARRSRAPEAVGICTQNSAHLLTAIFDELTTKDMDIVSKFSHPKGKGTWHLENKGDRKSYSHEGSCLQGKYFWLS